MKESKSPKTFERTEMPEILRNHANLVLTYAVSIKALIKAATHYNETRGIIAETRIGESLDNAIGRKFIVPDITPGVLELAITNLIQEFEIAALRTLKEEPAEKVEAIIAAFKAELKTTLKEDIQKPISNTNYKPDSKSEPKAETITSLEPNRQNNLRVVDLDLLIKLRPIVKTLVNNALRGRDPSKITKPNNLPYRLKYEIFHKLAKSDDAGEIEKLMTENAGVTAATALREICPNLELNSAKSSFAHLRPKFRNTQGSAWQQYKKENDIK